MRTLVTGATGFIGQQLVRRLLDRGDDVSVLTRRPNALPIEWKGRVRVFAGDLSAGRCDLPGDVESVIHCAGTTEPTEVYGTNVGGTRRIVEYASETPAVGRIVYLSSVGVIGPTGRGGIDETAACRPSNPYEASKFEAEQRVLESNGHGLVCSALRPSIVFGYKPPDPTDSFRKLIRAIASGRFRLIGTGTGYYNIVYVEDVAAALIALATAAEDVCAGRAFIANDPMRWDAFANLVANLTGGASPKSVASSVAYPAAMAGTALEAVGVSFPLTLSRYRALTNPARFSGARLRTEVGFRLPYGTEKGLELVVERYNRQDRAGSSGWQR